MQNTSTTNQMGRYELRRVLGRGSQGKVYLGYDPELEREVAIKLLTSDLAEFNLTGNNGTPLEALTSSRLEHPHIVPIHDIGQGSLGPYLVFGFVPGRTLANELSSRTSYTLRDSASIITTILDAVAAAHDAGVLHLDLGPRNIMLDERTGKPQIMDFGLSQFVNFEREDLSLATGTLRYMAPEHFLRQELGPETDVFALASTIYELMTGRRAIPGESVESIQRNIVGVAVNYAPFEDIEHGAHIVKFLKGAFVMEKEERYANARAMLEAFKVCVVAAGLADEARGTDVSHSTVDFLMRRMQHKKNFPAISSTLNDINRLAGENNNGNADKLANVILRDMSLTSKLLTMSNSSFYGTRATEITNVSQAVVLLGVQQVRMVASSLTLFGHLKGDSEVLRDSMTKSFLAGLIARHLAQREKIRDAEEAFIAGMCQNLGENLTIYYFPEEHDVIREKARSANLPRRVASIDVLGCSFAQLGAAVAKVWSLPQVIIDSITGIPEGGSLEPADDQEKIRNVSVLANELCSAFFDADRDQISEVLEAIAARYAPTTELDDEYLYKLFAAAYEKLTKFAPIFEINVNSSEFCSSVQSWLAMRERELAA